MIILLLINRRIRMHTYEIYNGHILSQVTFPQQSEIEVQTLFRSLYG